MYKTFLLTLAIISLLLSGCLSKPGYQGISFPKSSNCKITFQESSVGPECTAFAHLLIGTKKNSNGEDISLAVRQEAEEKGANLILVGFARELPDAELKENRFDYYGPDYAYNFNRTWLGWIFGFDEWDDGGKLVGLGTNNLGNKEAPFAKSLLVQAVFLRCEPNP